MGEEAKSSDVKFFSAEMIIRRSGFRRLATPCDFAFNTNISDEIVKCVDVSTFMKPTKVQVHTYWNCLRSWIELEADVVESSIFFLQIE